MSKLPPAVTFRLFLILSMLLLAACGDRPDSRPAAPTGVKAEAYAGFNLVSWEHDGKGASGFAVYRAQTSGLQVASELQELVTLAADAREYEDRSVAAGSSYRYAVVALGAGVPSPRVGTDGEVVALDRPGFTATLGQPSVNVYVGRSATVELVVTPTSGYAGEVAFALTGDAEGLRLTPVTSTIAGEEPVQLNLTLTASEDAVPGKRELQLLVAGDEAPDSVLEFEAVVRALPRAGFVAEPEAGIAPLLVEFAASGMSGKGGLITRYEWSFGDGASGGANAAEGSTVSHEFARSGSYEVQLTVWDDAGESAIETLVVVVENALPTAGFSMDPEAGTAPLLVSFDGSGSADVEGEISSYFWEFRNGDGDLVGSAAGVAPRYTFGKAGLYTVVLTVMDDDGGAATASDRVEVQQASPRAEFTVSDDLDLPLFAFRFDASASLDPDGLITHYHWDFGDGSIRTSEEPVLTHAFPGFGHYQVSLSVTDDDGNDSGAVDLEVEVAFKGAVQVAAGHEHSLALLADGSVWAWGWNEYGQIGSNAPFGVGRAHSVTPVRVAGLPQSVSAIAAGGQFSLALLEDGTVMAWGNNRFGQLGNGEATGEGANPVPVLIPGLVNVISIAASGSHVLALLGDGRVMAWGNNTHAQAGIDPGAEDDAAYRPYIVSPVLVAGLVDVRAIAAGQVHSLALLADGKVMAWGAREYGELGDGIIDPPYRPEPGLVQLPAGITHIASSGSEHSIAVETDGSIWMWGGNFNRQIDDDKEDRPTPVRLSRLAGITEVNTAQPISLAVLDDGSVWTWGINLPELLGRDGHGKPPAPLAGLGSAVGVAGGYQHALVLLGDGTVWTWGWNRHGQLGRSPIGDDEWIGTPVQVTGLPH